LNKRGFTLVELLVALSIVLTALAGSVTLYQVAVRSHVRAVKMTRSLYQARSGMEAAYRIPATTELETVGFESTPIRLLSLKAKL
jgi:prepilin-type N-terminal cleavage/methylation domain-containing protein